MEEPAPGRELAAALAVARRRATRDGDGQTDTAHLLHALLEADPAVRDAVPGGPHQVARLLGYLVQRAIGYGLRWKGAVEESGAPPVPPGTAPGWSPAAAGALRLARARARTRGAAALTGPDVLGALVADPRCRAVDVLRRAGADTAALAVRLEEIQGPAPAECASRP
ncbi:peptidase [Streptomyces mashuensis]|uniref:Peptidase n=1 Tax=Streptomyces mashuensis TaxID=33904 RepID=A0A919BAQ5_9ACTN|nr:Clp protease N-terminal domain-containing protein [Streptomyces mashuensis]GHF75249.1 peptidase [Streptomyces mashuensis]